MTYTPDPFAVGASAGVAPPTMFPGSFWNTPIPANVPAWWSGGIMPAGNNATLVSNFVAQANAAPFYSPYVDTHSTRYVLNAPGGDPGVSGTWEINNNSIQPGGYSWPNGVSGSASILTPTPNPNVPDGYPWFVGATIDRYSSFWDYGDNLTTQFWNTLGPTTALGNKTTFPNGPPFDSYTGQLVATNVEYCGFGPGNTSGVSTSTAAAGNPYLAGIITVADYMYWLATGKVTHAIMIAVSHPEQGIPVNPATISDGNSAEPIINGGIPEGTWFYIPSSVPMPNFAAGGVLAANVQCCEMIFTMMQQYGAIIMDSTTDGGISIIIENPYPWAYGDPNTYNNYYPFDWSVSPYGHIFGSNMPWSSMVAIEPGCMPSSFVTDNNGSTDATLKATQAFSTSTAVTTITLNEACNANDVLVVTGTIATGATGCTVAAGGGGTATAVKVYDGYQNSSQAPEGVMWVLYGCSAGLNTLNVSMAAGGDFVITRWSGFGASNPIINSVFANPSTTGINSLATGNVNVTATGQIVIGAAHSPIGGAYAQYNYSELTENAYGSVGITNYGGTAWSNGRLNRHILNSNGYMLVFQNCIVPTATGNVSATQTLHATGVPQPMMAGLVVLQPGSGGGNTTVTPQVAQATATAREPNIITSTGGYGEFSAWLPVQTGFIQAAVVPGGGRGLAAVAAATAAAPQSMAAITVVPGVAAARTQAAGVSVSAFNSQLPVMPGMFQTGAVPELVSEGAAVSLNAVPLVAAASATAYMPSASVVFTPETALASASATSSTILAAVVGSTTSSALSFNYTPQAIGNALVIAMSNFYGSGTRTLSAVSSGNATWSSPSNYNDGANAAGINLSMCLGTVTSAASATISLTLSGGDTNQQVALFEVEGPAPWSLNSVQGLSTGSGTALDMPYESAGLDQFYFGFVRCSSGNSLSLVTVGYNTAEVDVWAQGFYGPGGSPVFDLNTTGYIFGIAGILSATAPTSTVFLADVTVTPGVAAASATAYAPPAWAVTPEVAQTTAAAWEPAIILGPSVTINATASAYAPSIATSFTPLAAAASATAYASAATARPAVPVGTASAIAYSPSASVTISPVVAAATAAAYAPDVTTSSETTLVPDVAPAVAAGYAPGISITAASLVSGASATAYQSISGISFAPEVANALAAGASASASVTITPVVAQATASALLPLFLAPGTGAASATAHEPAIATVFSPLDAGASVTAYAPTIESVFTPDTPNAGASANQATVSMVITPQVAAAAAAAAVAQFGIQASPETAFVAATAGGTDTGYPPAIFSQIEPETANADASAYDSSVSGGFLFVTPIVAQAVGEAFDVQPAFIHPLQRFASLGIRAVNVSTVPVGV